MGLPIPESKINCFKWESDETEINCDDLDGIFEQVYAIKQGWGMGFVPLEKSMTYSFTYTCEV